MTLYWVSNTMTDQSHLGRTFTGVTNTAGTSVVTIPWLLSNLTDI
ncbi:hypothetical protein [Maritalea sp.]